MYGAPYKDPTSTKGQSFVWWLAVVIDGVGCVPQYLQSISGVLFNILRLGGTS
jgi:hypothetical protein